MIKWIKKLLTIKDIPYAVEYEYLYSQFDKYFHRRDAVPDDEGYELFCVEIGGDEYAMFRYKDKWVNLSFNLYVDISDYRLLFDKVIENLILNKDKLGLGIRIDLDKYESFLNLVKAEYRDKQIDSILDGE